MTLDTLIMLSGLFVLLLPQLGFPPSWDTALFTIAGIVIIGLGIAVRRRGVSGTQTPARPPRGYEESKPRKIATSNAPEPLSEHESA